MRQESGQGLVEYLILTCLIGVAAIGVVSVVSTNLREQYANISAALRNKKGVALSEPDKHTYQHRGMDDYLESGTTKQK